MASDLKFSTTLANARADAITSTVGASALLNIYDGTKPAGPGTAITTQVLLAQLTCNATFAPAASGRVLTLNSITQDASSNNTGTASWFRLTTSGGTAHVDGTVGSGGTFDLVVATTSVVATQPFSVTAATITEPS